MEKVYYSSMREYFSISNIRSILRGFVYEYETPKIVTIHSISIALMCRIIQLIILIYGIVYLMIHKKGYQETNTSIISSITLKVKGIGYNQSGDNQTLVIDGADYIVPPQENNALFLMTNFIRTDQEHKRCAESPDEKESACWNNQQCLLNKDFKKANGKWTGRCLMKNSTATNNSQPVMGRCELEGWCPVENDRDVPQPIHDALNFTIFVKNFIEFPRFKVIRKNIQQEASYLKKCNYHPLNHKICPIFRVGTLLDMVEPNPEEQIKMLTYGGVIRVKIDWKCNLDKPLDQCLPEYSFGRLDAPFKEESFSLGFNFRFASHWKHQNRSFRTLTKAFGLRFIISVSGQAGRFDIITLSLNIGSLIGILGLATFICDIVALYVHRQSDEYRKQKFQDVDLNLVRLENLNNLAGGMMSEALKRNNLANNEHKFMNDHVIENHDGISMIDSTPKEKFRKNIDDYHQNPLYDNVDSSSAKTRKLVPSIGDNYHQQDLVFANSPTNSLSSPKQRRTISTTNIDDDKFDGNIESIENDSLNQTKKSSNTRINSAAVYANEHTNRSTPKLETFL